MIFHPAHIDGMGRMLLECLSFPKIYSPEAGHVRARIRVEKNRAVLVLALLFLHVSKAL